MRARETKRERERDREGDNTSYKIHARSNCTRKTVLRDAYIYACLTLPVSFPFLFFLFSLSRLSLFIRITRIKIAMKRFYTDRFFDRKLSGNNGIT